MHRLVALLSVVLLLAAACGEGATEPAAEQDEEGPDVAEAEADTDEQEDVGEGVESVTTIFPTAWLAEQVAPAGEHGYLAARGQDPHDLELSPGDRSDIETADVVIYVGDIDFQPQVEDAMTDATGEVVSLAQIAGTDRLLPFGHDGDHDDHGHDDNNDEHGDEDPHVWLDPEIMAEAALAVGEAFAAADPEHAQDYEANANEVAAEIRALGDYADERLGGECDDDTAIVSHEAYQYLLAPYGLEQEGISDAGGHGEASPQRLVELTERIQAEGVPAVLAEPIEGREDAETLASEADVELIEINPLELVAEQEYERGYVEMLREQVDAFADALGCA